TTKIEVVLLGDGRPRGIEGTRPRADALSPCLLGHRRMLDDHLYWMGSPAPGCPVRVHDSRWTHDGGSWVLLQSGRRESPLICPFGPDSAAGEGSCLRRPEPPACPAASRPTSRKCFGSTRSWAAPRAGGCSSPSAWPSGRSARRPSAPPSWAAGSG